MVFPLPIRVPSRRVTLFIRTLLSPISTFLSMKENGPISQFSPILAEGSIYANGLIFAIYAEFMIKNHECHDSHFHSNKKTHSLFLTICAVNSASPTSVSPTNISPRMEEMPCLTGASSRTLKMSVSPGTTFFLNFTLSIFMK